MTIDDVITDVLRREGWPAVTQHASDRGGLTKGGITLATACEWFKRALTREEFERMVDESTARLIYRERYAAPYLFIPHERLKALLVDYAVTSWHDDAIRALQRAVGTSPDGVIGDVTRAAILDPTANLDEVYRKVYKIRQDKFVATAFDSKVRQFLADHPGTQLHNLRGWLNRLVEFA